MDREFIIERFNSWTRDLSPKEARVSVFEHIRDIPYYLVSQIEDPLEWGSSILQANKGSCSPKHYLLGFLFGRLNIPVKYVTYPFKWSEQKIRYTDELRKLAQGSPTGYHSSCKAYLNNKWVLVDATWDIALAKVGFPVNIKWDGESDTMNAVLPFGEIIHNNLEERLSLVKEKKALQSQEEKATYARFIEKFNLWLEELRGR